MHVSSSAKTPDFSHSVGTFVGMLFHNRAQATFFAATIRFKVERMKAATRVTRPYAQDGKVTKLAV
jgi:hypothetical protein